MLAAGTALADSYEAAHTSEIIDASDVIVVGVVEPGPKHQRVVRVAERLKGRCPKLFVLHTFMRTPALRPEPTIIFLRRTDRGTLKTFHPGCYRPAGEKPIVQMLLAMRKDPAPFVDIARHPPTPEIVHTVGSLFAGFRMESGPQRGLGWQVAESPWEFVPWSDKSRISLLGIIEGDRAIVSVTSGPARGQLASYMKQYLEFSANPVNRITRSYWVRVDARVPERVGTLSQTDALAYLRARLDSTNGLVVIEAIKALARMRDLESVERIRALTHPVERIPPLTHRIFPVASYAKKFVAAAENHEDGVKLR